MIQNLLKGQNQSNKAEEGKETTEVPEPSSGNYILNIYLMWSSE